jgi:hypothetical protein
MEDYGQDGAQQDGQPFDNRKPWTPEEDDLIARLVKEHGLRKWAVIAAQLHGRRYAHTLGAQILEELMAIAEWFRSGKQCRERYKNQVNLTVKHTHLVCIIGETGYIFVSLDYELIFSF